MKTRMLLISLIIMSINLADAQKEKRSEDEKLLRSVNVFFDRVQSDTEIEERTWYKPHYRVYDESKDAVYLYFSKDGAHAENLYMRLQYRSSNKIHAQSFYMIIDDVEYLIIALPQAARPGSKSFKYDWIDIKMLESHRAMLEALSKDKDVKVRIAGTRDHFFENVDRAEVDIMDKSLEYYRVLGGQLPVD